MKSRIKIIIIIPLIVFSIISYSSNNPELINDIIPPVKLIAGQPDTVVISDLFYAPDYDIAVESNPNVQTNAINNNSKIIFTADPNFEGITTVNFKYKGEEYSIPVYSKKLEQVHFTFKPSKKYKSINLFGSFNGWNRQSIPMEDKEGNGIYSVSVTLEPGRYEYKFYCDGEELLDPKNENVVPNGIGGYNSLLVVKNPHEEKVFLHKKGLEKERSNLKFHFYLESNHKTKLSDSNIIALIDNKKIDKQNILINEKEIVVSLPIDELKKAEVLRTVVTINGINSNMQVVPLSDILLLNKNNFDWHDGIIYSIMIDRFYDGNKNNDIPVKNDSVSWKANYMGGDFEGITQKINEGYFDSLGVNILWLSPVVDNPDKAYKEYPAPHRWFTGYHGYWPIAENKVEEKFGTFDDLKNLIKTAHQHKIKILLDFVSHHVHEDNPLFKKHRNWFGKLELPDGRLNLRLWDEQRLTTWFEPYMPSFDFIHSDSAVNYMSDNAIWWLKQTGADGFRHDAVKHVPNKFWRALTRKIKREIEIPEDKKVYQIGETFGDYNLVGSYVNNGQLDAQFNFELFNTALAVFLDSTRSFKELDLEMKKSFDVFGPLSLMGNIMDSHDKVRFMAYADGDVSLNGDNAVEIGWNNPPIVNNPNSYKRAELYFAYMMSIPGIPVIYYGSEFGMTGAADPDNRRMMRFGQQLDNYEKNMLRIVSDVTKLRSKHSALRYGDFYTLHADENIYAFIRSDFNERILVVLNKSKRHQTVELNLPEVYNLHKAENLLSKSSTDINDGKIKVKLDGYGWIFLKLE
ncbi:alpha-amylase family glycosyl hydrolase [Melioribacteraceae bacterium 4301-Me]|uniref:alpha-amylase family glycosyl hydrolase n=1 Tax=Pyranulibacter aquaticus TaxID=3163344 RepID=UPI003595E36C